MNLLWLISYFFFFPPFNHYDSVCKAEGFPFPAESTTKIKMDWIVKCLHLFGGSVVLRIQTRALPTRGAVHLSRIHPAKRSTSLLCLDPCLRQTQWVAAGVGGKKRI